MGYFSKKRRSPSRESVDVTAWPNSERIPLALALSTASERGGAVAGNPSSDSLQYDVKERLSRHALDHHIDIFFVSSKAADTERVCRGGRPAKQRKNSAEIGIVDCQREGRCGRR